MYSLMDQVARHLLRIVVSYLVAAFSAGMVFAVWASNFLFQSDRPFPQTILDDLAIGAFLGGIAIFIGALPSALMIYCAERRGWRGLTTHLAVSALIGLVCTIALAPGLIYEAVFVPIAACSVFGGFVYWGLAGRKAGPLVQPSSWNTTLDVLQHGRSGHP